LESSCPVRWSSLPWCTAAERCACAASSWSSAALWWKFCDMAFPL